MDIDTTATTTPRLNPWFSMWFKPRATIQQIIETDPTRWVLLLVAFNGIFEVFDRAMEKNLGDGLDWTSILLLAVVTGPLFGVVGLFLFGWLVGWTGRWIGGIGSHENIRAAIAWATIPTVWALALWIPMIAVFGQDMFVSPKNITSADPSLIYNLWGFSIVLLFAEITAFILLCQTLGQVQGFSAWKALGNVIIAVLVVIPPLFLLIFVLIFYGIGMFAR